MAQYLVPILSLNDNSLYIACRRPTALHDRTRDSDDDEVHDRDYDLAGLANNLNQFRYNMQENNGAGEVVVNLSDLFLKILAESKFHVSRSRSMVLMTEMKRYSL